MVGSLITKTPKTYLQFTEQSYEQPQLSMEEKSTLQGAAFWGPEVALSSKGDRNRTSKELNAHVPQFLLVHSSN